VLQRSLRQDLPPISAVFEEFATQFKAAGCHQVLGSWPVLVLRLAAPEITRAGEREPPKHYATSQRCHRDPHGSAKGPLLRARMGRMCLGAARLLSGVFDLADTGAPDNGTLFSFEGYLVNTRSFVAANLALSADPDTRFRVAPSDPSQPCFECHPAVGAFFLIRLRALSLRLPLPRSCPAGPHGGLGRSTRSP